MCTLRLTQKRYKGLPEGPVLLVKVSRLIR